MSRVESIEVPVAPPPQDGKVTLRPADDRMQVWATVTPPLHGGAPVTLAMVAAELADARVTFGVDEEAVAELVRAAEGEAGGAEGSPVVVARGEKARNGEDGEILHHELLQTPVGYPRLREDGTVDFFELNAVRNVQERMVLATRKPPGRGIPGTDVYGQSIVSRDGRDVKLRAGKGAVLAPDGQAVLSAIEGHATLSRQGEITVSPIFAVDGNVDFHVGNIDFVGTVIIRGDVMQGFTVKAGQNVEVHGGVMGGCVEAGGDVMVRYGILGFGQGRVVAGGGIQCRFVEGAEVRAGGDVTVVDAMLNARVLASGSVSVTGSRGSIIGGQIQARTGVSAKVLGSSVGVLTEIQVGVPPEVRLQMDQIRRRLHQVEERMGQASHKISTLREVESRMPEAVTASHRQALQQATRSQHQYRTDREQLLQQVESIQAEFEQAKHGQIRAFEVAHPGVRIVIGVERYTVRGLCHRVLFFLSGEGLVEMVPL